MTLDVSDFANYMLTGQSNHRYYVMLNKQAFDNDAALALYAAVKSADWTSSSLIKQRVREYISSESDPSNRGNVFMSAFLNAMQPIINVPAVDALLETDALSQAARYGQYSTSVLLNIAIRSQDKRIIKRLASSPYVDLFAPDIRGFTPLYWACVADGDQADFAEVLISLGANANQISCEGLAIIYVAAQQGNTKCVELLAQNGADVNWRTPRGNTPLGNAAEEGRADTVRKLLELGANPHLRNHYGSSAADLARNCGHYTIASFIDNWRG